MPFIDVSGPQLSGGFDMSDNYPGHEVLDWLRKNTNLRWNGMYLAVKDRDKSVTAARQTWKGKFSSLKQMGWGVAPIYMGKQVGTVKGLAKGMGGVKAEVFEGANDGDEAVGLAAEERIPNGTVLYFDAEGGDQWPGSYVQYLEAWVKTVLASKKYVPGIYCSPHRALQFVQGMHNVPNPPWSWSIWAAKYKEGAEVYKAPYPTDLAYHPRNSGCGFAVAWQYRGDIQIPASPSGRTIKVDLSTSIRPDIGRS
jgi:hypothetical protein